MTKLLALVLLAALLVTVRAAPHAEAARSPALATTYVCDFGQGSGIFDVSVRVRLPRGVSSGEEVAGRGITVSLVLPADAVETMRQFGVESVAASARRTALRLAALRPGVRRLKAPRTDLPPSGELVLRAAGRVSAFTAPRPGRYAVRVPRRLRVALVGYDDGSTYDSMLACAVAPQAPTRLGTLQVRP